MITMHGTTTRREEPSTLRGGRGVPCGFTDLLLIENLTTVELNLLDQGIMIRGGGLLSFTAGSADYLVNRCGVTVFFWTGCPPRLFVFIIPQIPT